jgi:DNA replicative helicase MCM subunit Mcm2 (Cdc46/Mcm family)
MVDSPIKLFPVPDALKKHGIDGIMVAGTSCNITRKDGQPEIVFDIGKAAEQTIKNFSRAAKSLKLDYRLQSAIKFYFIQVYHEQKKEADNKRSNIELRKLDEDEDILGKEGEGEKKERARRAALEYEEVTIPECVRRHKGAVKVVGGMISGSADIEKMVIGMLITCEKCNARFEVMGIGRPKFRDEFQRGMLLNKCPECEAEGIFNFRWERKLINVARTELQEIESAHGVETLHTILLEDCTNGIRAAAGQPVILYGEVFVLHINRQVETTFVFVYNIEYLQRDEILELSNADLEEFDKFVRDTSSDKIMDKLAEKFSVSIFGHEEIKKGILLSAVNTSEDSVSLRRRLNTALIGETGLAKSKMLRNSCELVPKSKFCSAPTSSVRSWIAIINKDSGLGPMPRYGNIVLANGGICAIDEIGYLPFEDQGLLLNAYQEGKIPFAKHGITLELPGSATFIVSSNPKNPEGLWKESDSIELSEIPLLGPLRDRTDLIFIMRGNKSQGHLEDFALKKIDQVNDSQSMRELEQKNHGWLRKYIFRCKDFDPKISTEAKVILAAFYRDNGGKGSPRMVETLYNIAWGIAKYKHKHTIDEQEAIEAVKIYSNQLKYWSQISEIPVDTSAFIRNKIIDKLRDSSFLWSFEELVRAVCVDSKIAAVHIGNDFKVESNKKLRAIRDMFVNSKIPNVLITSQKPLTLAWEPTYDWNPKRENKFDPERMKTAWVKGQDGDGENNEKSENNENRNDGSVESDGSDGSVVDKVPEESSISNSNPTDLNDPNDLTDQEKNNCENAKIEDEESESEYEKYVDSQRERIDRELNEGEE